MAGADRGAVRKSSSHLLGKVIHVKSAQEQIRVLFFQSAAVVKDEGKANDPIERTKRTAFFEPIWTQSPHSLDAKMFTGRAGQQVRKFAREGGDVDAALHKCKDALEGAHAGELHV